jgi:hypothetical protein
MKHTLIIAALFSLTACESERPLTKRAEAAEQASSGEAGGTHQRVSTAHGPLHVWTPANYTSDADIVVYIHGYYVDVDEAWTEHRLASQFAESGLNALFVAIEAPASFLEPVRWASLSEVLGTTNGIEPLPSGRVIVAGHSAAHRTLLPWLVESQLDTLVLVDAVYGDVDRYRDWVMAKSDRRLVFVGDDTREWTDELHQALPGAVVIEGVPEAAVPNRSRMLYVKSDLGHFELTKRLASILRLATGPGPIPVAGR